MLARLLSDCPQACLREYGNDPEAVVNHVLEGSLPPHLKKMVDGGDENISSDKGRPAEQNRKGDRADPRGRGTEEKEVEKELLLVEQRSSVFDDDEFDVFRREKVDLSRVHIGKR